VAHPLEIILVKALLASTFSSAARWTCSAVISLLVLPTSLIYRAFSDEGTLGVNGRTHYRSDDCYSPGPDSREESKFAQQELVSARQPWVVDDQSRVERILAMPERKLRRSNNSLLLIHVSDHSQDEVKMQLPKSIESVGGDYISNENPVRKVLQ
jgi:hypothetical protein